MELNSEVAIISIFGRGVWLAAELAKNNIPVTLLEISNQMGTWKPEDAQGPFGVFSPLVEQVKEILGEAHLLSLPQGLTLWTRSGSLEFRGPNIKHCLQQLQTPQKVIRYLDATEVLKASDLNSADLKFLESLSFQKNWLMHFAHALSSNVATLSTEAFREASKRNLFSEFSCVQANLKSYEQSLKWCESFGVQVLRNVELKDISFIEKAQIAGLEIRTSKPGMFKANQFVICLTSEEAGRISSTAQSSLFSNLALEPDWVWSRFEVSIFGTAPLSHLTRAQLPAHFIVLGDLDLPWSHENFMIWQKRRDFSNVSDSFDVWMKIPNSQRFQRQYLQDRGQALCELMQQRLPENEFQIQALPLEATMTFQDLGPTRQPVYSRALKATRSRFEHANHFFNSPEYWSNLSLEAQFEQEQKIRDRIFQIWQHKEELRIKREQKERVKNQGADL